MNEKLILLVDADRDTEALVRQAAARLGAELLVARTHEEARAWLDRHMRKIGAVVIDVDAGAADLALLEALGSCAEKPSLIVLTALEEGYMEPISQRHGAASVLGKPLDLERVTAALHEAAPWSGTCDRQGHLLPPRQAAPLDWRARFRGLAAKLSPFGKVRDSAGEGGRQ